MERKTLQRQAILHAFERLGRPLSPQEILEAAQTEVSGLGIATVYRNLKSLTSEARLKIVEIPGQSPRYELSGRGHHHHFHCRGCQQVYEVDGCPGGIEPLLPKGFTLEDHEVVLYGLCAACAKPSRTKARRRLKFKQRQ
jgi:Fur family ferric uptake transcriptional regulator